MTQKKYVQEIKHDQGICFISNKNPLIFCIFLSLACQTSIAVRYIGNEAHKVKFTLKDLKLTKMTFSNLKTKPK